MQVDLVPEMLSGNPAVALPLVFAGGVLTSLTPCIYPMIPITAAVVGGQTREVDGAAGSGGRSTRRTVALTLSYVVGLALTYALLGLVAGLTGSLFGAISTNPWLYFLMANLLLVFGLMLLDAVPVPVPDRLLARAAAAGDGGRIGGTFVMGAASGLVAAPCGAPVMAAVLTWVAATQSAVLGFLYLFVFSLGMTSLLVVVGLTAGGVVQLPKAGSWMAWVKRAMAVVLIVMAEYYLIKMGGLLI